MRVILIGKSSGRLDCLAETIARSHRVQLFILTNYANPSLSEKGFVTVGPTEDPSFVSTYAGFIRGSSPTLAVISNEESLAAGIADVLRAQGILTVGPSQAAAQIETSKIFARRLLDEHGLREYNPEWGYFSADNLPLMVRYARELNERRSIVIKPDGLTGGKGVQVQGEHFGTVEDGLRYASGITSTGERVIIEEKIDGQEFSRMCFTDGETTVPMPAVQDHKRLLEYDSGPNTGGMGSYSDCDHNLPYLTHDDTKVADYINRRVVELIERVTGHPYIGILYGNFIATRSGIKVIEFNARFGDPEAMNVLPLLQTDFVDLCWAVANKRLEPHHACFADRATVCKYILPETYPFTDGDQYVNVSGIQRHPDLRIYYGALDGMRMTGSRALALVGLGSTIAEAEVIAEQAAQQVTGPIYHRRDIGTDALIERRVLHMEEIRATG